jgi:glycosyltransferase involved in cell wall biosynthesis
MKQRRVGPIRVLFFISEYDRFHGAQRSLLQLVQHLPAAGVEPVVAFPAEGRCTAAYRAAGIRLEIVPAPAALCMFGQHLLHMSHWKKMQLFGACVLPYSFKLVQVMQRLGVHILHCNTTRSLLLAGTAAFLRRYPIVWHVRGQLHAFNRMIRLACEVLASRTILVASALQTEIHPLFVRWCQTIYNGIDAKAISGGNDKTITLPCGHIEGRPVVATLAAVTPFKGYHHLLAAACLINQQLGERRPIFLAIGELFDQSYVDYLQRLIHQYEIDNVHFLGWQEDPLPYYQLADVVVLPTVERERLDIGDVILNVRSGEGFPRTVLEAMYLGKPVVATTVAGTPEQILHEETGLLVPPSDPVALANAIIRLLQAPASVRQAMGQKAALRVRERFTTERMVRDTIALYRELVGNVN